jgi:hypothetical protein
VQPPVKQSAGRTSNPAQGGDEGPSAAARTTEASAYADSLRATLSAQKQAEQMLAVATRVRGEAAAQGERILLEAQEAAMRLQAEAEKHAERARIELSAWAADQRKAVDAAIGEVIDAAHQEAERVRNEAVQTARAEAAKQAGRQDAGKAAGRREAERIQSDAVRLLTHSRLLLSESRDTLLECATVMAEAADSFRARAELTESLLEQVGPEPAKAAPARKPATQATPAKAGAGTVAAKPQHGRPLGSLFHGGEA